MWRFDIHPASFLNVALHLRPHVPALSVPGRRIDASMQELTPYPVLPDTQKIRSGQRSDAAVAEYPLYVGKRE